MYASLIALGLLCPNEGHLRTSTRTTISCWLRGLQTLRCKYNARCKSPSHISAWFHGKAFSLQNLVTHALKIIETLNHVKFLEALNTDVTPLAKNILNTFDDVRSYSCWKANLGLNQTESKVQSRKFPLHDAQILSLKQCWRKVRLKKLAPHTTRTKNWQAQVNHWWNIPAARKNARNTMKWYKVKWGTQSFEIC